MPPLTCWRRAWWRRRRPRYWLAGWAAGPRQARRYVDQGRGHRAGAGARAGAGPHRAGRPGTRATAAGQPAADSPAAGAHDKDCARLVFPNLITNVATTDATVTDNQMTEQVHDALVITHALLSDPEAVYTDLGTDYYERRQDIRRRSATTSAPSNAMATHSPSKPPARTQTPKPCRSPKPANPHTPGSRRRSAAPAAAACPAEGLFSDQDHRSAYRCVSSGSYTFVFSSPT